MMRIIFSYDEVTKEIEFNEKDTAIKSTYIHTHPEGADEIVKILEIRNPEFELNIEDLIDTKLTLSSETVKFKFLLDGKNIKEGTIYDMQYYLGTDNDTGQTIEKITCKVS